MRLSAAQEKVVRAAEKGLFVRTTGGMYAQWYVCKEYGSLHGAERVQLRTVESVRLHGLVENGPRITMDMHSYRLTKAGREWIAKHRVDDRVWKSAPGCPEPTPELVAAAKRVATREWTVAPDDPVHPIEDPQLEILVRDGLATLFYPPTRERLDYWTLTAAGRTWLKLAHGWLSGRSQGEVEAEIRREQQALLRRARS